MGKILPPLPSEELVVRHGVKERQQLAEGMRAVAGKRYSQTRTYASWNAMISRCYRPYTNGYHNYGGRGITVCERWRESFLNFLSDMGERPVFKQLDRINTDGNYAPENCRWVTIRDNARNRRDSVPWIPGESEAEHKTRTHRAWRLKNWEQRKRYKKQWASSVEQRLKTKLRMKRYYEQHRARLILKQREYNARHRSQNPT